MSAASDLRDAIQQKATAIAAKSSSLAVDQWAAEIVVLAAQIPLLPPTVVSVANPDGAAIEADLTAAEGNMNRAIAGVRAMIRLSGTPVGTTPFPVAAKLSMSVQPSSGPTNDVAFSTQPQVVVQDTGGVTVPLAGTTITAALASGTGTLGGTLTAVTASTGIATFTNLKITGLVGAFTIVFTATSLSSITSSTVTTVAGAATKLSVTTQPAGAVSTVALTTQPVIAFQDLSSNPTGTGTADVVATIASGSGALSGTTTKAAVAGVATFTNLVITGTGAHTLTFSSTGITAATSTSFTATTPGSFVTPNKAIYTYETGAFPSGWKNTSLNADPPYNVNTSTGNQVLASRPFAGTYSRQFDYAANAAEVASQGGLGFYNAGNGGGPLNVDELYWLFHVRFDGNSPTTAFKWQRFKGIDGPGIDCGGLYYSSGNISFCFGGEGQNENHALGLWKGTQPAGLTSAGYTAFQENLQNNATYHSIMVHLQRIPAGGLNPRVRFWWDGAPIIQPVGAARNVSGGVVGGGGSAWTAGSGSDPDYGASAPSWLTANTRSHSAQIRYLEINGTINAGNTGVGSVNIDNEYISSVAIDPAL